MGRRPTSLQADAATPSAGGGETRANRFVLAGTAPHPPRRLTRPLVLRNEQAASHSASIAIASEGECYSGLAAATLTPFLVTRVSVGRHRARYTQVAVGL